MNLPPNCGLLRKRPADIAPRSNFLDEAALSQCGQKGKAGPPGAAGNSEGKRLLRAGLRAKRKPPPTSAARLSRGTRDPWLCVATSRWLCLFEGRRLYPRFATVS